MATYTKSEIRGAILRAANRINSQTYNFCNSYVPDCGTPGCMWGWIGLELGIAAKTGIDKVASAIGHDMDHLYSIALNEFVGFTTNASIAADALRAYADKYFPAEQLEPAYLKFRASLTNELVA